MKSDAEQRIRVVMEESRLSLLAALERAIRPDERALLLAFAAGERARDAGQRLGIHPKRVYYLCCKWEDLGWQESGVCEDLGWLTEEGRAVAAALSPREQELVVARPLNGPALDAMAR